MLIPYCLMEASASMAGWFMLMEWLGDDLQKCVDAVEAHFVMHLSKYGT